MSDQSIRTPGGHGAGESHASTRWDHLAASHIMTGDVGVFAGDWAAYDHHGRTRHPTGFVGRLDARRGREGRYAGFSCDRSVAETIVAEQERLRDETRHRLHAEGLRGPNLDAELDLAYASLRFEGDEIVLDERLAHDEADGLSRICPDDDGRYLIRGWGWQAVDPADCDRIVGTPPAAADQPARIPLIHSPLHVPHNRLAVTSLHEMLTYNGVAFTATLCLGGTPVGVIQNEGNGGETWLRHHDSARFSWHDMREFVARCRYRRQPTDEETVLDRLVTEYDLARRITSLPPNTILARTANDDRDFCGDVVVLESLNGLDRFDQLDGWADLATYLATFTTSSFSTHWQVWLRDRWHRVSAVTASTETVRDAR